MTLIEEGKAFNELHLRWMVILHVTFLFSGFLLAPMDGIVSLTEKNAHAIWMNPAPKE